MTASLRFSPSARRLFERHLRVGSTHSRTVRCDILGHRRANGRKATGSRLTDAVTSTTAPADEGPFIFDIRMAGYPTLRTCA
jgi:hypothetical protein